MLCEAASPLGLTTVVLAERADDAAVPVASEVLSGAATDVAALRRLARRCDAITFDHELVELETLRGLERSGVCVRPGTGTLAFTVDKALMRRRLEGAGVPVPSFEVLPDPPAATPASPGTTPDVAEALDRVKRFGRRHGWPLVLKAARGGYDGKGVWMVGDARESEAVLAGAAGSGTPMLVEERVAIRSELAVVVARRSAPVPAPGAAAPEGGPGSGGTVSWPAAETVQVEGVCREVLVPGSLPEEVAAEARGLATAVADLTGAVGVLAVEMFWTGDGILVNELAARPHNSGHWTIEGAATSQFENHLRAVLDLPLGDTGLVAPCVASVNVFGGPGGEDPGVRLSDALADPGAHVHLYGKGPRPGRKLGHVTLVGDDAAALYRRAWRAAAALGTPTPDHVPATR
jgi:5-(carboxyamino)imidazole ribonucleotide synthase